MSLRLHSLRHALTVAACAAIVAGCSTTADLTDADSGLGEGGTLPDGTLGEGGTLPDGAAPVACGRLTTLCGDGAKCASSADCTSQLCSGGACAAITPADGVKNGDETDVDCGGTKAPACLDAKGCSLASDCKSGVCTNKICQAPTPTDGVQNGNETGIDCGGSAPTKCVAGAGCLSNADCDKLKCDLVQKKCLVASHSDGVVNDGETGVDCGGSAPTKCATGQGCASNADCNAVACDAAGTKLCLVASHTDGVTNLGETGIDCGGAAPTKCPTGQGCLATADCDKALCDVAGTKLCLAPTHSDGIVNLGETGIDCGGAALPLTCGVGQGCAATADCTNTKCNAGTLVCDPPTKTDNIQNGTETDIDCGGGAPTNARRCNPAETCSVDGDCASTACNYAKKCVESRSCKGQHGGDTCGPNGNESCCVSLAAGAATIDKYNITAGRMRAFVTAVNGDMRGYIALNTPAWWTASWSNFLPTMLDNGQVTPDDTPAYTGVYQELGPYIHGAVAGGNRGCNVSGPGARTYRIPDDVNTRMVDPQSYTQDFLDDRSLNCVTVHIVAAFCAWDGGRLPTRAEMNVAWGPAKYPWGATGTPLGYRYVSPTDPNGTQEGAVGSYQSGPFPAAPLSQTDLKWANYNFNYWGGSTQLANDYSIFVAPPGRFPNGNGPYGHADLAGNVFNALDINVAAGVDRAYWTRSGSWQGHPIPWSPVGSETNFPAHNKYWAMGGRCAR